MKAKEWTDRFGAATAEETVVLLEEYAKEIGELVAARTKNGTDAGRFPAAEGAVRELRQKFASIQAKTPALTLTQFDEMVLKAVPSYPAWEEQFNKAKAAPQRENDRGGNGRSFAGRGRPTAAR